MSIHIEFVLDVIVWTHQAAWDVFIENFLFSVMHFEANIAEKTCSAFSRGVQAAMISLVVLSI